VPRSPAAPATAPSSSNVTEKKSPEIEYEDTWKDDEVWRSHLPFLLHLTDVLF
jgi:hypothetical protein